MYGINKHLVGTYIVCDLTIQHPETNIVLRASRDRNPLVPEIVFWLGLKEKECGKQRWTLTFALSGSERGEVFMVGHLQCMQQLWWNLRAFFSAI